MKWTADCFKLSWRERLTRFSHVCSCGKAHWHFPKDTRKQDMEEPFGWAYWFDCTCHSSIFIPFRKLNRIPWYKFW